MATSKKVVVTVVKLNNKPADVPIVSQAIDTEVIDGQIVPLRDIVNPGVKV